MDRYSVLYMRQLDLSEFEITAKHFNNFSPRLKKLTLRNCSLEDSHDNSTSDENTERDNHSVNIDTLRLISKI